MAPLPVDDPFQTQRTYFSSRTSLQFASASVAMPKAGKPASKMKAAATAVKASNKLAAEPSTSTAAASSAAEPPAPSSASQPAVLDDWNAIRLAAHSRLNKRPDESAIEALVNRKFSARLPTLNLASVDVDLNAMRDELRASAVAELSENSEIRHRLEAARAAVEALAIALAADPSSHAGDAKKAEIAQATDAVAPEPVAVKAVKAVAVKAVAVTEKPVAKEQMPSVAAQDKTPAPAAPNPAAPAPAVSKQDSQVAEPLPANDATAWW